MSTVMPTVKIDTSRFMAALPQLVATGRRALEQQCVTSLGWIMVNAQKGTPAVSLGRIDAELEVDVNPVTAKGRPSKAKNPKHFSVTPSLWRRHPTPLGVLIVMARMRPNSDYNKATGNRWAIPSAVLPKGPGTAKDRQTIIGNILARMTLTKHSSTHYLQHGFAPCIRRAFSSPYFQHSKKYRNPDRAMGDAVNKLNTMDHSDMGLFSVMISGENVRVVGENNLGEGGPSSVLNQSHRAALLKYATGPTQAAVNAEADVAEAEIARRMADSLDPLQRQLG